jgi:WD40 repeat protein
MKFLTLYHTNAVSCLALLNNNILASGSYDRTIKLWSLLLTNNESKLIQTLIGHNGCVYCLTLLNDGIHLASGSDDRTIRIWNIISNCSQVRILSGHQDSIQTIIVLNDGTLASGSDDKTIKIWDTSNGEIIKTLNGHSGTIYSLVVLNNGILVSCSGDKTIKLWNTKLSAFLKV